MVRRGGPGEKEDVRFMKRVGVRELLGVSRLTFLLLALLGCGLLGPWGGGPALAGYGPEAAIDPKPSPLPDRVILTWSGDPSTTQSVTWRTDATVEDAYAEIAVADRTPEFYKKARRVAATTSVLDTESGDAHYHSVRFTGLEPGTLYAYRVASDEGSSEWFQFRTATGEPRPFSFIYFGDAQRNILALWSRVVRSAFAAAPDARFLLHAGDLVNNGEKDEQWGEWFRAGSWIFGSVPSIPVIGNHEYVDDGDGGEKPTDHWGVQFTLPGNGPAGFDGTTYFVDYDGVRVVVLNSFERLEEQTPWLESVLRENPNRWTVAAFHHPVYSATGARDNEDLRDLWKPLFERYGVDLVLQGHDHTYARGRNLPGEKDREPSGGPMYVVSVSGPKMYEMTDKRWMDRAAEDTQLYHIVAVNGDTLRFDAFTAAGEKYDAFDLIKTEGGGNLLVDRWVPHGREFGFQ